MISHGFPFEQIEDTIKTAGATDKTLNVVIRYS